MTVTRPIVERWQVTLYRSLLIAALAITATLILGQTPVYERVSLWLRDSVDLLAAEDRSYDDIVIVDVDEDSLSILMEPLGAWPYARDLFARVTDVLNKAGARAIVYDIVFAEDRPDDDVFAAAIERAGNTVLAAHVLPSPRLETPSVKTQLEALSWPLAVDVPAESWADAVVPQPRLTEGAGVGLISVTPDVDGVIRRLPLFYSVGGARLPGLALASLYPGARPAIRFSPGEGRIDIGNRSWPVDPKGRIVLDVPRNPDALPVMPFYELAPAVLDPARQALDPALFAGKVVFIGSSAARLGDYARLPGQQRVAGLGILALAYHDLAHGYVLVPERASLNMLLMLVAVALPLLGGAARDQGLRRLFVAFGIGLAAVLLLHLGFLIVLRQETALLDAVTAGALVCVLMLMWHVERMHLRERQLSLEKAAAENASRFKSRFIAGMSHELRTPMTSILGFADLLSHDQTLGPEQKDYAQTIRRAGGHLLDLINELLDTARIEAGKIELIIDTVDLAKLVDDCVSLVRPLAISRHIVIESSGGREPAAVTADYTRTKQVLINLLSNAIKYNREHGRVDVGVTRRPSGRVRVSVSDTGPGIPADSLDEVFEPYRRLDSGRESIEGTGIGLSISKTLVEMMNGDLGVESEAGQGATFWFELPEAEAEAEEE